MFLPQNLFKMFRPSENANDLFRRMASNGKCFEYKVNNKLVENLQFGEAVEVQAVVNEIPEIVLKSIMEFASQFEDGLIVHLSSGNSFHAALKQCQFDISGTPLEYLNNSNRVKSYTVTSMMQLLAVFELLKATLSGMKTLIIMEGLSVVFLAQKSITGALLPSSLIQATLKSLQDILKTQNVISLWVSPVVGRLGGGLRDGAYRDPVTILWKQKFPKVFQCSYAP